MANKPGKKLWLTALIVIALLAIFLYTNYNRFIRNEENLTKTWNNVQSDYQRRLDLVPNLVSAVKASSDYEKETLTKLIEARANAAKITVTGSPTYEDFKKSETAQADVATSANRVIAVIEKYPDLKTTNSFIRLQDQLIGTERRIKFSRNDFNKAVMEYNKSVRSFPASIAAALFSFKVKDGFTADTGTDRAPEINFNK
jgi:LemA protein